MDDFYDPTDYGDPGGSFPPDMPVDWGIAGSDTANPGDASVISSLDGASADTNLSPDINVSPDGTVWQNPDGSITLLNEDGTKSWGAPDGSVYDNVNVSPNGTIIQFSDGSVLDTTTGDIYGSYSQFVNAPAAGGTQMNGTGRTSTTRPSAGVPSGGGSSSGGSKSSGGGSAAAKPDPALASLSQAMAKFGAGIASLLSAQSKTTPGTSPSVATFGANTLGSSVLGAGGFSIILVLGGIGLILLLMHKGG